MTTSKGFCRGRDNLEIANLYCKPRRSNFEGQGQSQLLYHILLSDRDPETFYGPLGTDSTYNKPRYPSLSLSAQ